MVLRLTSYFSLQRFDLSSWQLVRDCKSWFSLWCVFCCPFKGDFDFGCHMCDPSVFGFDVIFQFVYSTQAPGVGNRARTRTRSPSPQSLNLSPSPRRTRGRRGGQMTAQKAHSVVATLHRADRLLERQRRYGLVFEEPPQFMGLSNTLNQGGAGKGGGCPVMDSCKFTNHGGARKEGFAFWQCGPFITL